MLYNTFPETFNCWGISHCQI